MNVRHLLGDAGLAVLLALPTATLASPSAVWQSRPTASAPSHVQTAMAEAAQSRFGFPS
jgi:hypothetical protein